LIINLEQLKQILDLVREHELSEFEIEQEGVRIKVKKDATGSLAVHPAAGLPVAAAPTGSARPAVSTPPAMPVAAIADGEADVELAVVKSPIVGTFYRSPEPGAPAFVEIGASVKKGQVLCIVEAMKLMNEIESEYDGEVVNVYVENGQPVQYGERLFAIRTK
jgi:acetyl-CoA carboxylase biotin carboxyl carrier protein